MAAPTLAPRVVPGPQRTALRLIANPRASRVDRELVDAAARELGAAFHVDVIWTEGRGQGTALAREAVREGLELVVAAGGDGTFNEVAAGLSGSETALACLPGGVTNVFARSIGAGRDGVGAARRLAERVSDSRMRTRRVDVGLVNERPFLCTSGVGFSASMSATADAAPARKARFGQLHFAAAAGSEIARRYLFDPPRMRVEAGGRSVEGMTAMVQNTRALTYFGSREIVVCHAAGLDSGTLSTTLLRRARPWDVPVVVGRLIAGSVAGHPQIAALPRVPALTVVALDRPLPLEADGEYLGDYERVEYGVQPGALLVAY